MMFLRSPVLASTGNVTWYFHIHTRQDRHRRRKLQSGYLQSGYGDPIDGRGGMRIAFVLLLEIVYAMLLS